MFRKILLTITALLSLTTLPAVAAQGAQILLRDGLLWADVQSGGATLHFVVDTGAGCSCVNLAAAKSMGLKLGQPVSVAGVGGRAVGYRCAGFSGTVGGMQLPGTILSLDLSGPARACSRPIDGLIGADFFRGNVVRIDYARGLLTRVGGSSGDAGIRLRFANGVLCVPVAVNGSRPRWTRLDTGCTDALIWCDRAGGLGQRSRPSVALSASALAASAAHVAVGGMEPRTLPVRWADREIFPGEAGLLGNAALSRYKAITIDATAGRLAISM